MKFHWLLKFTEISIILSENNNLSHEKECLLISDHTILLYKLYKKTIQKDFSKSKVKSAGLILEVCARNIMYSYNIVDLITHLLLRNYELWLDLDNKRYVSMSSKIKLFSELFFVFIQHWITTSDPFRRPARQYWGEFFPCVAEFIV